MVIRDYTPANASWAALRYDRFGGGGASFLGAQYDWSGIGHSPGGQWGTMISASYFLTAYHYQPSTSLTFYEYNTLTNPHTYPIASLTRVGTTDLCLGKLATPIAPQDNITFYPLLWGTSLDDYLGTVLYNVGQPFRVGRNVVDDFGYVTISPSTTFCMVYDYDNSDLPSVGGDETYLQGGDSGGPSFGAVGGSLGLAGIHWFIYDDHGTSGSGDSFVPAYAAAIDSLMNEPLYLLQIPEPGTMALLLGGCLVLACRARRAA